MKSGMNGGMNTQRRIRQVTNMKKRLVLVFALLMGAGISAALAQEATPQQPKPATDDMSMDDMDIKSMPGMDQGTMPGMDHSTMPGMDHSAMPGMDHSTMQGMDHSTMQGGTAPPDARDPHAYSGGYTLVSGPYAMPGPRMLRLADEHSMGAVMVDRLEAVRTSDNTSAAYDVQAWYGRDYDRAVLKAEGDYDDGELQEASTELLWGHAVAAYWNTQAGLRLDSGEGPDRTWLAFGVQGLAPYWFEVDATAYVGDEGRTTLNLEAEYELLLTQQWILQPRVEANWYGKRDSERGIGSGLSELNTGLRLRYEIRREFAPYVGIECSRVFGATADYTRDAGLDIHEMRAVAGVRAWF